MHNIISFNNLKAWSNLNQEDPYGTDLVNDYFECITECGIKDRECMHECRLILD
jgi:hypothetical protein